MNKLLEYDTIKPPRLFSHRVYFFLRRFKIADLHLIHGILLKPILKQEDIFIKTSPTSIYTWEWKWFWEIKKNPDIVKLNKENKEYWDNHEIVYSLPTKDRKYLSSWAKEKEKTKHD